MDTSHELHDTINTKVKGKMKIETSPIIELDNFVALRSKPYSFTYKKTSKNQKIKNYNIHQSSTNL